MAPTRLCFSVVISVALCGRGRSAMGWAEKKKDSSYSKAASLTSLKATSTRVPQAPFLSSATSRANRLIDSTLADPSNPVTHNDSYRRA
ncbi:hypothetical protein PGTUg99_001369 [Puccinia graminis f. sp. tritici]|uniref:Secreted protein n=1 Tax=Puccinia graminis f. sp. tritici TaxID=56615 RepID=A0A5B0M0N8_PUCGR|nr:hypothetical protein PGTUg99_002505 [Puccinia graminis f. sp. tritici]KAA1130367.1 hypothetical protein PGTUg99_001369 [Puccinia graminis f. sp. tritici]